MAAIKWIMVLLLAFGTTAPMAMAQDDAYTTPARAKAIRQKEVRERAEQRKRMLEQIKEQQRREAELRQRAEQEYQEYQAKVEDWYNRRGDGVLSEEEMKANYDRLQAKKYGEEAYQPKGGKYAQRLRRFSDIGDDVIILKDRNGGSKIYVIDQDYYDPWTSSYYARDWNSGVNIIINDGPYWGWGGSRYYRPYRSGWAFSWGYPYYDRWYDPWYYGSWGWNSYYDPYFYGYGPGGYWRGGYWGGYYDDSYWYGYNQGRWDNYYSSSSRVPYSRYGRSGGYYGATPRGDRYMPSRTRSNAHSMIYGRALGNSPATDRGYYNRAGQYVDRTIGEGGRSYPSTRYDGNATRNGGSNSRWNRSGSTYERSGNSTTTRSGGYSSGSSSPARSNSGSSGGGSNTGSGGGSHRRTR